MSGIPSDVGASAAQAGYQQAEAARVRDGNLAAQADASRKQTRAASEAVDTVETEDADARVYADAEGTGGQGRHFEEEGGDDTTTAEPADQPEDRLEDGDEPLLDIQA